MIDRHALRWIYFVSRRFGRCDRNGRSAITSLLASLGVCFGVMALVVVLSVMNGFQLGFIDAVMEISSYHVRVENVQDEAAFLRWCSEQKLVVSVTPFYEAQGLMVGNGSRQCAALVRALPANVYETDAGFAREVSLIAGKFDLSKPNSIVIGIDLARQLGMQCGRSLNILALSGSSDVALLSQDRQFTVRGIFYSGYSDINMAYSFISLEDGEASFGASAQKHYGIKLSESSYDAVFVSKLKAAFPEAAAESWKSYNRTFFGALRFEKNMLIVLVFLIFVIVVVNIYNGMRRMVYERREEIAVISALGGRARDVQAVFVMRGFLMGLAGAVPGLLLGLFLCVNIYNVFMLLSKLEYAVQYAFAMLVSPGQAAAVSENPMFSIYASIPTRMLPGEIAMIFCFGVFSSVGAAMLASRQVLRLTVVEVLRDE